MALAPAFSAGALIAIQKGDHKRKSVVFFAKFVKNSFI